MKTFFIRRLYAIARTISILYLCIILGDAGQKGERGYEGLPGLPGRSGAKGAMGFPGIKGKIIQRGHLFLLMIFQHNIVVAKEW